MEKIYLDNAATTPISSEVLNEMMPYLTTNFGNPNSIHSFGRGAKAGIDKARLRVAHALGCNPDEVFFTSGATESNNWFIREYAHSNSKKGKHIITTKIEHPSVIEPCKKLEQEGYKVTYLDVDQFGLVKIEQLLDCISADTILIAVMTANNEVGTIQNVQAISNIADEHGIAFFTDATQAVGAININMKEMGIEALSFSGHKINGPKGVGVLCIQKGVKIASFMLGGEQESGMRAGTSNVAGIVGLGKAVELACRDVAVNSKKLREMRDYLIRNIKEKIDVVKLNGHPKQRLPNNVNMSFGMIDGESLTCLLDTCGIAVSTGSACSSGLTSPSHVLQAMGLSQDFVKGAVRFSLGVGVTKTELDYVIAKLVECVNKLRKISPKTKKE
ncbi:MAG: cysteine desulfurase [Clostridia bacterium]|nr:cysteine desulfurase [Clostridia bacterium]